MQLRRATTALCVALIAACARAQEGSESVILPSAGSSTGSASTAATAPGSASTATGPATAPGATVSEKAPLSIDLASAMVALQTPIAVTASADNAPSQLNFSHSESTKSLAVHFSALKLADGDKLVLRGKQNENYTITTGSEPTSGGFWSRPIAGSYVTIELVPAKSVTAAQRTAIGFAVAIDGYKDMGTTQQEENCGTDDSQPAKCLITAAPNDVQMYLKAQAVARVLINGSVPCSGAVLGASGGYFITAAHCIHTAKDAREAILEFGAESSECSDASKIQMGSQGSDFLRNSELYAVNIALDYVIVKLDLSATTNLLAKFGSLKLRAAGATSGEELFIPHHPNAYAKRVSAKNGGKALTAQVGVAKLACSGQVADQIAYTADTVGGSSGAPVISAVDYAIIGVHRCGGCTSVGTNSGLNAKVISEDLKAQGLDLAEFY